MGANQSDRYHAAARIVAPNCRGETQCEGKKKRARNRVEAGAANADQPPIQQAETADCVVRLHCPAWVRYRQFPLSVPADVVSTTSAGALHPICPGSTVDFRAGDLLHCPKPKLQGGD